MKEFKFNPQDFGFWPIDKFPEVLVDLSSLGAIPWAKRQFIKVVAVGGDEFGPKGRTVFWYDLCDVYDAGGGGRITIQSDSYCSVDAKEPRREWEHPRTRYFAPIKSAEFASLLLENVIGADWRKDLNTEAREKLDRNAQALTSPPAMA